MKKTLFQLILVALAVSSCATARYYGGFTPEAARQDMVLLGPVSNIYYLDRNNRESFDDSLSTVSEALVAGLVHQLGVPVSGRIELDVDQKEEAAAYMRYLAAQNPKHRDLYAIPGLLDDALEAQGCRYGLLLFTQGMTRDSKGLAKEVARDVLLSVATAVLTMGSAVMIGSSMSYSFQAFAAVLDAETNQIVFYNLTELKEKHPLRQDAVRDQLRSVLKDFLN